MTRLLFLCCGLFAACAPLANAAIRLNEIYVSPEDIIDDEQDGNFREFFELISTTGGEESLDGLWFLEINGEGIDAGTIEQAIDLSTATNPNTGSNGLFLWRASADVLSPPVPDPDTVVHVSPFSPDLQQGDAFTFLIVRNFTGMVGQVLDTGFGDDDLPEDGFLEITPWDEVVDAVTLFEVGTSGFNYAFQLGGANFNNAEFGADAFSRLPGVGQWFAFDSSDGFEDPNYFGPFFANDPGDNVLENGNVVPLKFAELYSLTPGSLNAGLPANAVPEPASIALAIAASIVGLALRRRR